MFTPILDEVNILIQDIRTAQNTMIIEQGDINNPNLYLEYSGGIKQLEFVFERATIASINIDDIIEHIMRNAADGNYSAKMKIVDEENRILREKIDIMQDQIDAITNNLDKENEVKIEQLKENIETNIEERLEL